MHSGNCSKGCRFGRWIEQLVVRYNAEGPESLGDLRRRNGAAARVLKPEVLDKLRVRLKEPPNDGGLWTSAKVAAFIARELGLEQVAVQRGWEALKAWHVDPNAASEKSNASFARRGGGVEKKLSERRHRGNRETSRTVGRGLRSDSIGSA